ncbi:MAG: hypothetical protein A2991_04125 [Candidatus Terrybacteria bacterium RIFCSPLOWO2_01_FULL_58_14]|uniref:Metalloprotease TldD/E C-terminal domain-containing protein n=2 Tax=Candidatus Terryibacteriota TaxID=1817920 RepID=A0A1G2PVZ5_9BACT|nr:MAG: hypothetical protein A2682_03780 [Candidatus Terrybacteria bacterium RIFCSPHIGHO2_01_FULL_58_15]OHA52485.1 MAG: hypothetical protein A2991_04125 [Candidatus Terrybacteria bacterium RIFCSPLOWO2_01_FULL_58_14]
MRGKEETLSLLACAVDEARRAGVEGEANIEAYRESTMRSAWGEVHQTPVAEAAVLRVEVRDGLRAATVEIAETSQQAIREAIARGCALLSDVPENPYLPDLANQPENLPEEILGLQELLDFSDDLAIKERAFDRIRRASQGTALTGSARFFTAGCEKGVANTAGLSRYHTASHAFLALVVSETAGLSSYAERAAEVPSAVDVEGAIEEAFSRAALMQRLPVLDPFADGKGSRAYDAIFTHYAVGEWLWYLSWSFDGLSIHERTSYLGGRKLGDIIAGSNVTLAEDWRHLEVVALPFDYEGRTSQRVPFIEHGRFRGAVYDGMSAKKAGVESTGHSGGARCLVLQGGEKTFDELIALSDRPTVIATFLNYPGMPDEREAVFTATTRYGTFFAEDGKARAVCPPLRLRVRSFDALSRIEGMTPSHLLRGQENYGMFEPVSFVIPAMRIRDVDFVGSNA